MIKQVPHNIIIMDKFIFDSLNILNYNMKNVLNIEPYALKIPHNDNQYNLTFLSDIFYEDIENYYKLILSNDAYKLKNIYNYLFLRIKKINHKFPSIDLLPVNKNIKTFETFDRELNDYIKKRKLYGIIIINSIQQYHFPVYQ